MNTGVIDFQFGFSIIFFVVVTSIPEANNTIHYKRVSAYHLGEEKKSVYDCIHKMMEFFVQIIKVLFLFCFLFHNQTMPDYNSVEKILFSIDNANLYVNSSTHTHTNKNRCH